MKETKAAHTPGPWRTWPNPFPAGDADWWIVGPGGVGLAEVYVSREPELFIDAEANARLMAAALDLLEALQQVKARLQHSEVPDIVPFTYHDISKIIRAAIAKARGEA